MFVKLHRPYFVSGEMRFPGGEPVEVPDDLGAVEIAKGNAVPASAPAAESEPAPVVETEARKGKGGKRGG